MTRANRAAILLALSLLASLFTIGSPAVTPTAQAAEPTVEGNYVPLAKPARLVNRSFRAGEAFNFTAIGVSGIPRAGTTGLVLAVTGSNNGTTPAMVQVNTYSSSGWLSHWVDAVMLQGSEKNVTNTVTLPVDDSLATNHLTVSEDWDGSPVTIQVDVVGYYTENAVGGGFVPVRHTTLFDTRSNSGAPIPAGGTITKTVTGGIVPTGATSVYIDLIATNITAAGGIIAVPTGTDTATTPVMRFSTGGGAYSNLVAVKVGTGGQITFKNTSTATVHLVARAEGYTTSSPNTGGGWRPIRREGWENTIAAGGTREVQLTDTAYTPASGVGGIFVNMDVWGTTGSGYLRATPSGQAAQTTSLLNYGGMTSTTRHRQSGAILVPGSNGKVVIENTGAKAITLTITKSAYFTVPTNYTTAGGPTELSVAHTSAGPCYGYLEPTAKDVRVGCSADYESNDALFASISPANHTFRGPVSVVARPNGRLVVSALHVPDGEVWVWEFAHTTGAPSATDVRTFRYMKTPVVSATLPDGTPVGFTTDVEGRVWALDLNTTAPNQPAWKQLEIPAIAPASALTATGTPAGIRLAATTSAGDVITGLYASKASTELNWQSLGATDAAGRVAVGVSQSGQAELAVFHTDNTMWTTRLDSAGQAIDGWHQASTTYNGSPVQLTGSPTMTYDPLEGKTLLLFRSDAVGSGSLYRVREDAPDTGVFSGPATAIAIDTMGIASDVTAWDYRTDAPPITRRYSFTYFDTAYGKKGGTSVA